MGYSRRWNPPPFFSFSFSFFFFFLLSYSVLSRNPDFKFGGGQFVFLPKFFFQHDQGT